MDGDALTKVQTDFTLAVAGDSALFALEGVNSLVVNVATGWTLHRILTAVVAVTVRVIYVGAAPWASHRDLYIDATVALITLNASTDRTELGRDVSGEERQHTVEAFDFCTVAVFAWLGQSMLLLERAAVLAGLLATV